MLLLFGAGGLLGNLELEVLVLSKRPWGSANKY
jgi:hypothetical protein